MGKGHWNRKRVYSIRKFAVGACSVNDWDLCSSIWWKYIGESIVFADETPIPYCGTSKRGKPAVEEKVDQAVEKQKDVVESIDQSQASPIEASNQRRKKMKQ